MILSTYTYPPAGRCIYCGTTDGKLKKEHIIPHGLGGVAILPDASCVSCERITGPLEQTIQRTMLGNFRIALGLPTRNPKQRPRNVDIHLFKDGRMTKTNIPASEIPLMCAVPQLPPPRIIQGLPHTNKLDFQIVAKFTEEGRKKFLPTHGEGVGINPIDIFIFLRFLAKIAHSFAIAQRGVDGFQPFLPDIILGKPEVLCSELYQLIGGGMNLPNRLLCDPESLPFHHLELHHVKASENTFVVVSIQLFCFLNMPTYSMVVGIDKPTVALGIDDIAAPSAI